jgi:porphobilinogen deaminase
MNLFSYISKESVQFNKAKEELKGINIVPESIIFDFNLKKINQLETQVQFNDLILIKLAELPFELPDFLVAAALLKRNSPNYRLVIHPDKIEMGKDFMLPHQAKVICQDTISSLQLQWLRPDFRVTILHQDSILSEYDAALVLSEIVIDQIDTWLTYDIQLKEIIPYPGEGVSVLLCHKDNINLRKTLKTIHSAETAQCSNVERTVLKTFDAKHRQYIGVHCEKDAESNFQVNAISLAPDLPVKKIHYSTVTSYELEKIVINKMINDN